MLDNGYVYLAASRLSLFRSSSDWAMVVEIFGFSPRAGVPDIHVYTFGSRLRRTRRESDFISAAAFETYLANNSNNESTFIFPIEEGGWQDDSNGELLARGRQEVLVRGLAYPTPPREAYAQHGIALALPEDVEVFEFCRWLAATARDRVLGTEEDRRTCVPDELPLILQVDEWHHPDVLNGERPSAVPTFRALAEILAGGSEAGLAAVREKPNTHWSNWPDAGTL